MANGRQIAEANVRKLRAWADEIRRPEDWAAFIMRIPMKPAIDSETKPATCSDFIPASIPI